MSSLIRWSPISWLPDDFERAFDEFGKLNASGLSPVIDIYQTDDEVVVETPLPGVDANNLQVMWSLMVRRPRPVMSKACLRCGFPIALMLNQKQSRSKQVVSNT